MRKLTILLIFMFFIAASPAAAVKIQVSDNWIYTDSYGVQYNETATDLFVLDDVSVVTVNTTRPFPYVYPNGTYKFTWFKDEPAYFNNVTNEFTFNVTTTVGSGDIVVTQLGGIPVAHYREVFIDVQMYIHTEKWNYANASNPQVTIYDKHLVISEKVVPTFVLKGNPSLSLTTGEPVSYSIDQQIGDSMYINTSYIISNQKGDNRNFVVQTLSDVFYVTPNGFNFYNVYENGSTPVVSLNLLQAPPARSFAFNLEIVPDVSIPVNITQTEPIKVVKNTAPALQSVQTGLVSYILNRTTEKQETPLFFYQPLLVLAVVILIKRYSTH